MSAEERDGELVWLALDQIEVDHEWNARDPETASPIADQELADDIKRRGLLQPLVVVKHEERWLLVAGFRRYEACKRIEQREVPCFRRRFEDLEQGIDLESSAGNLAENLKRRQLKPYEVANVLHRLGKQRPDLRAKDLADLCSLSEPYVQRLLQVRRDASPELWGVFQRYGKSLPRGLRFDDVVAISKLPRFEQMDAWNRLVAERSDARKRKITATTRKWSARQLEKYLDSVDDLDASAEFRAGVRYALRVALKREPWPDAKGT